MSLPKGVEGRAGALLRRLQEGLVVEGQVIRAGQIIPGSLAEQVRVEVLHNGQRLLHLLLFTGRPPHWRAWIELYAIRPAFFASPWERPFLRTIGESLGPGERLFVEYVEDPVTLRELDRGVPPALSRLGFLLFELGFTWFRNWYIPEGLREGEPKIQAEKPLDEAAQRRHHRMLIAEAQALLQRAALFPEVRKRAEALLRALQGIT